MKKKLKNIASIQTGYTFRSRIQASENGDTAVIQMKDLLDDNTVSCSDLLTIDMKTVKQHHVVQKGDLLFRSRGQVTTSAVVLEDPGKAIVAAPLLKIRITDQTLILPEYLNWYISQKDAQIFLTSRAKGTVQKMISKQALEDLEVSLPSLERQKTIVEIASLSTRERTLLHTLADKREQYISTILMQFTKGDL